MAAPVLLGVVASGQPYVPGQTYYGRSNYIEYIAGELPFILSAPHGGTLKPAEIPNRTYGTFDTDTNTEDLARKVRTEFQNQVGLVPHVVICRLDRDKIDCNREIVEGAQGDPEAEIAWNEFQNFILHSKSNATDLHGQGFYVDLHGHGHTIQRLELGYLLSSTVLGFSDGTLNSATYENQSSIRTLSQQSPLTFPALLRGVSSFGALIEAQGYPAVPSPTTPNPGTNAYFNGGYNTVQHGSVNGGAISGLQIESNFTGVRDTSANRTAFARALAITMEAYFAEHYGINLRTCVPKIWPGGSGNWSSGGSWYDGAVPVATNVILFTGLGGTSTHNVSALSTGAIHSVAFSNSVSGAYTLTGNSLVLLAGLTNSSTFTHVINNPITLAADQSFVAGSGPLTLGGSITNGGKQLRFIGNITAGGVISGNGGLTKSGAGTLALTAINNYTGPTTNSSGIISLNATATFGDGTGLVVLSGGEILSKNTRSVSPIANPIVMTASTTISGDGTLTNSLRILPFSSDSFSATAGTLTIRHSGTNETATNNIFRVRLTGQGFNFTRPVTVGFVGDLPSTVTQLESYNDTGDQTFSNSIGGTGQFRRDAASPANAGRTIFSGVNSYSGGTLVNAGTLLVNNPFGSGTGSGAVTVSNNGTLGGTGSISGSVWCNGTISAGQSAGILTLGDGLDLSAGGTNVWDLTSLDTTGAGTSFDQIVLVGGNLALAGDSRLRIQFSGAASAPDATNAFWRGIRSWKIISLAGAATNSGSTIFGGILDPNYAAGTFTTMADEAGSVWLRFVPVGAFDQPLIQPPVTDPGNGTTTLHWDAVEGQTYRIEFKDDLNASQWSVLDTIIADTEAESFVDTTASGAKRFYRIAIP